MPRRVRFSTVETRVVSSPPTILYNDPKDGWETLRIVDAGPDEEWYDRWLDALLDFAAFNAFCNRQSPRYAAAAASPDERAPNGAGDTQQPQAAEAVAIAGASQADAAC